MSRVFWSYLVCLLLLIARLGAQSTSAEIVGTVTAQDGAGLPGVMLTIVNQNSGQQRLVTADDAGNYSAPSLPVGEYSVQAELPNFRTQIRNGVVLQVAQRVRVDLVLEVGLVQEQITVTESAPLLQTTEASVGEVIPNSRITALPLNGRRYADLLLLSDNLVTPPGGTRGASLGQTGPSVAVAGQRAGHNMYFLDGASVTDQYFNNLVVAPPIDSIQEFNIQKSIYAAEYGGKASATISAATKSGGNEFHGSLYEFFRNSALDARNFFNGAEVPPLRQNQFGGTVGGPILHDQTFFFVTAESLRERRALTRTFSLPSASIRAGDFSGQPAIYDPLSGDPATGARVSLPGNRIPLTRLDPIAQAFLGKVPLPTAAGEAQNFVATPSSTNDTDQFATRLDHTISENDLLYGRFTYSNFVTFRPFGSTDLNETLVPGFGTRITTFTRNAVINHTHVFRPTLIHDLRFGYLDVSGGQELENQGVDFAGPVGLRGVTRDPSKVGFPAFSFADAYSSMGDPASVVSRRNRSIDVFSNLSWIRGSHTVKVGAYFFRLQFRPQDSPNARGAFSFTPRFSSSAAGRGDGNAFADFLLGYPSAAQTGIGRGEEDGRTTWLHLYAQDDWRATRDLTLNVGLRYEINGQMTDTANRLSNIEVDRFVVASDGQGRMNPDAQDLLGLIPVPVVTSKEAGYHRSLVRPSYRRFAPRFGFAWTPNGSDKTVVRAGFGLFFNQWAYSVQTALMKNLPFYFAKDVTLAADTLRPPYSTGDILEAPNTGTIGGTGVNQDFHTEYSESWTLSVQRMLAPSWVAEVNYFGSRVVGADDSTYANIPEPGPGPVAARRPNPNLAGFRLIHWGGSSKYHSLGLKLEKRLSAGASLNANYTWSKATDVASSPGPTFAETNFPQDVRNRRNDSALSSFDHRHRLVVSFSYELPAGEGHLWNPDGVLRRVVGGWSVNGTGTFQSASPFTVNIPNDNANIGPGPAQRPDVVRNPNLDTENPLQWFDTTAFQMPAPFTFGNAGRNIVFGDGLTNVDASLSKMTDLNERVRLQFRAEFFNLFNNVNFADAPGRIAFTPNFGRYFTAENPRQIQLALRVTF